MKRAMAGQTEAERDERVTIINAEAKSQVTAALGDAVHTMTARPFPAAEGAVLVVTHGG